MSDHPYTREAIERWRQGKTNVFDALAELEDQRDALAKRIEDIRAGYQGTCYACEPAAELNVEYRDTVRELIRLLDIEEESDSGTVFRPNKISSCRIMDGMQMNQCLQKLKELASE
jgi:regulator of replication initiation timing